MYGGYGLGRSRREDLKRKDLAFVLVELGIGTVEVIVVAAVVVALLSHARSIPIRD